VTNAPGCHLDIPSDPQSETSLLSHQSICLHMVDDILVYLAQPSGLSQRLSLNVFRRYLNSQLFARH